MRTLTAFAAALLLVVMTASVANAQAGKSKGQNAVTPHQADDIVDTLYMFLSGGKETIDSFRARMRQLEKARDEKKRARRRPSQSRRGLYTYKYGDPSDKYGKPAATFRQPSQLDDPSASVGGE